MDIREAVGTQVRNLRKERSLTQDQLAEKSGLSVDYIGKIERAATSPSIESLGLIAKGLDVEVRNLFDLYDGYLNREDTSTSLAELLRYMLGKNPEDVDFALKIIKQILER